MHQFIFHAVEIPFTIPVAINLLEGNSIFHNTTSLDVSSFPAYRHSQWCAIADIDVVEGDVSFHMQSSDSDAVVSC